MLSNMYIRTWAATLTLLDNVVRSGAFSGMRVALSGIVDPALVAGCECHGRNFEGESESRSDCGR